MEIQKGQILNFPPQKVENKPIPINSGVVVKFKFSKIITKPEDITQWGRTTRAVINAGMSLDALADAGEDRGDQVERVELDAPSTHNLQGKLGEIIEAQDHIQAWQEMGEVLVTNQLPNPASEPGVVSFESTEPQKIGVIEGMGVFSNQTDNSQLESNPYLLAPADLKKAA